jgi:heme/copper-type cytochrome/quinol oxidase subunit 2
MATSCCHENKEQKEGRGMNLYKILLTIFVTVFVVLLIAHVSLLNEFTSGSLFKELNTLANVILAFSTVIYVLLTGYMIFVGKKTFEEANRPYVVFSLETPQGSVIDLVIKNVGNRPAEDVSISTNPKLESQFEPFHSYHDKQLSFAFLPPNYEHRIAFDSVKRMPGKNVPIRYDVNVKYRFHGNTYSENFCIDLTPFVNKTHITSEGSDKKIIKQLSDISGSLNQLVHCLQKNDK